MLKNLLSKVFSGQKKDGFFLQLEDEQDTPKPAAKAKPEPAAQATEPAATTAKSAPAEGAERSAPVAISAAAPAKVAAPAEQKAAPAAKKSAKKVVEKATKSAEVKPPAPAPLPAAPPITNFAPDYVSTPSNNSGRRRPGANMNTYLDMARKATKPEPFKKK